MPAVSRLTHSFLERAEDEGHHVSTGAGSTGSIETSRARGARVWDRTRGTMRAFDQRVRRKSIELARFADPAAGAGSSDHRRKRSWKIIPPAGRKKCGAVSSGRPGASVHRSVEDDAAGSAGDRLLCAVLSEANAGIAQPRRACRAVDLSANTCRAERGSAVALEVGDFSGASAAARPAKAQAGLRRDRDPRVR